jgi:hypothetical protein
MAKLRMPLCIIRIVIFASVVLLEYENADKIGIELRALGTNVLAQYHVRQVANFGCHVPNAEDAITSLPEDSACLNTEQLVDEQAIVEQVRLRFAGPHNRCDDLR